MALRKCSFPSRAPRRYLSPVITAAQIVIVSLGDRRMAAGIGVGDRPRDAQARRDLAGNRLPDFALKRQQVLRVALYCSAQR